MTDDKIITARLENGTIEYRLKRSGWQRLKLDFNMCHVPGEIIWEMTPQEAEEYIKEFWTPTVK